MPPKYEALNNVSRETYENLKIYYDLLLRWQRKINLISNSPEDDVWQRHFDDALQLISILPEGQKNIYDLGSGAGFPGLVIALSTENKVTLIESDSRKCSFLRAVSRETKMRNLDIQNKRIEEISLTAPDIVTARALASLDKLLAYCYELWGVDCEKICFVFPKGKNWSLEIEDSKANFDFDCVIHQSKTSKEARILEITRLRCV